MEREIKQFDICNELQWLSKQYANLAQKLTYTDADDVIEELLCIRESADKLIKKIKQS
jgi:hypothetical protein